MSFPGWLDLKVGDIVFVMGRSWVSKLIRSLTFSDKATHACIVSEHDGRLCLYETESFFGKGGGKSCYVPLEKYDPSTVRIVRWRRMTAAMRRNVVKLTNGRVGTPYSHWDLVTNASLFFLHPKLKGKMTGAFGTQWYTKCDEETMIVFYAATGNQDFKDCEAYTPQDLYSLTMDTGEFDIIWPLDLEYRDRPTSYYSESGDSVVELPWPRLV